MSSFSSGGFLIAIVLHKLFALAFMLGLLFFIFWALRNLKKDQLKKWAVKLMVIGLLGGLLAGAFSGGFGHRKFKKGYKDGKSGYGFSHDSMWKCKKDASCNAELEQLLQRRGF